jgi:tetratricopeptide (TPR) repeat protein
MNLGTAYQNRIRGERAENLEEAIAAYNRALQISTREDFPQDWAMTQMNLGNAYKDRIRGERAENLEEAIAAFNRALQIYTRDSFPREWAGTQGNLGLAYGDRIQGDKAENLEQAIKALDSCLEIYTQESFPEDWARNVHNLADAYIKRVAGNPEKNIEQAISLYNQAAEVFTQSAYPHEWFRNQAHLASAYLARASLLTTEAEQLENLNTAVALLKEALDTADPDAPTPDYIDAQYQLGAALMRRRELTHDATDLEQSLEAYRIALKAISPEHYDREKMWQALPETQIILGSRMIRDGEWHKGLELLQAAITELRPKGDLLSLANAYHEAGIAYEVLGHTEDARIYYRDALRLYEKIHHEPGIARSHHSLGAILSSKGYLSKALDEFEKARDLYKKLGNADKVAEVDGLYQATEEGKQEFERLGLGVTV